MSTTRAQCHAALTRARDAETILHRRWAEWVALGADLASSSYLVALRIKQAEKKAAAVNPVEEGIYEEAAEAIVAVGESARSGYDFVSELFLSGGFPEMVEEIDGALHDATEAAYALSLAALAEIPD